MRRGLVILVALACLLSACSWQTTPLVIDARPQAESSRIYASDGTLIATLHGEENRETVPLASVPQHLRDAVVAIEDSRFWQHKGVDGKAVLRALYANAGKGKLEEGGSTITQQYVKNELVGNDKNARRKLREAAYALELEKKYSKARILELYLNTIYFGNGAYGVQAAAHVYFQTSVDKLDLSQSALLAGLIRAPSAIDPFERPDLAAARRQQVLDRMLALQLAAPDDAAAAAKEALPVQPSAPEDRYPAPFFVERVKRLILDDPRFGETPKARRDLLFSGGLRIYTTLDLKKQAAAEDAVAKVINKPATDPAAALVSIEPRTGYVRAVVGGRDFFGPGPQAKFDLATQGHRPAGSSFKPFVLAAALEKGVPLTKVFASPARLDIALTGQKWTVNNYEGEGGGRMNLIDATVHSINTVYAQLILDIGPSAAVAMAAKMGITSPLSAYPSAVLGTNDVTPLEMASAYGTFATGGMRVAPTLVTRIIGSDGATLFETAPVPKRVMKEETAAAIDDVLQQVVLRGTGVNARIGRPVAGKTGTGEAWRDAWFVGYTPDLVTSVWVGFPDRQVSMVPPTTRILVQGGTWPAQIWQLYSSTAMADLPVTPFPVPPPLLFGVDAPLADVTNVIGMPVDQAEPALSRDGFRATRHLVPNNDYPPGYVVASNPPPGTQAPGGSTVVIDVSTGSSSTTVPDLLDLTQEQATASVTQAALAPKAVIQQEPKSPGAGSRKGHVWKQSPSAGAAVNRNVVVTFYVNPDK